MHIQIYFLNFSRQCYLENERYLKFFNIYSQQNCELECLANLTITECGCAKFSMPHQNDIPICNGTDIQCYTDVRNRIISRTFNDSEEISKDEIPCNCFPTCTSIIYEGEIIEKNPIIMNKVRVKQRKG